MKLLIRRKPAADEAILGELFIDGVFECFTLENAAFEIPIGLYPMEITPSHRFGRLLPLVENVPGRSGIRMHAGNMPVDSEGCILLGQRMERNEVLLSRAALDAFQPKLASALAHGDHVTLTITEAPEALHA